ncbi:MAG TPA: F0F1 ATP synthase subunit A [Candidatus Binatia bacterium]|nr:F0F1 ATP synthase subunit A [Candidatus Binatia bacterium]
MHEQLWLTALLNKYLAGVANTMLGLFHLRAADPQAPITNYVAMQLLVFVLLVLFFAIVRARLSVDNPGPLQHAMEGINSFIATQSHEVIGHGYERYVGYLTTLGLFILVGCLIGLIPGFETATASPSVPLGCALVTWFYYHMQGIRLNGFGYVKHFLGPVWWLAPLMFLIEVCSHLARILSLTIRLFANMFASDMVTLVFFMLFPIGIPVIFMLLHAGVALIQTYIFVLLATVYIGEAVAHEL